MKPVAVEPTKSLPHPLYVSSFIALLAVGTGDLGF